MKKLFIILLVVVSLLAVTYFVNDFLKDSQTNYNLNIEETKQAINSCKEDDGFTIIWEDNNQLNTDCIKKLHNDDGRIFEFINNKVQYKKYDNIHFLEYGAYLRKYRPHKLPINLYNGVFWNCYSVETGLHVMLSKEEAEECNFNLAK